MITKFIEGYKVIFFRKSLFFPDEKLLVISDTHIGYQYYLSKTISKYQFKKIIDELELALKILNEKNYEIEKLIITGDIKDGFSYPRETKLLFKKFNLYLHSKFKEVILIKGNHDYGVISNENLFYLYKDILFLHGNVKAPKELYKRAKLIVQGHQHPAIKLKLGTKVETFKTFVISNLDKDKKVITLPSFSDSTVGSIIGEDYYIAPYIDINQLESFIIIEDDLIYEIDKKDIKKVFE